MKEPEVPKSNPLTNGPLWPRAALISFFGTLSLVVSLIVPKDELPPLLLIPVMVVVVLFFVVAVMTSGVAFTELVTAGLDEAGSRARGWGFLACYLMPWALIFLGLAWALRAVGISR